MNKKIGISDALKDKVFNNCSYSIIQDNYNTLRWNEKNHLQKPSENDLLIIVNKLKAQQPFKLLRKIRDDLLCKSDKYVIVDWPHMSKEIKEMWYDYRQKLRDLPSNSRNINIDDNGNLLNVNWPIVPPGESPDGDLVKYINMFKI